MVFSRGITTDNTGIVGLYFAISLYNEKRESVRLGAAGSVTKFQTKDIKLFLLPYLAALPDEVKTIMTEALTLIAARTWIDLKKI